MNLLENYTYLNKIKSNDITFGDIIFDTKNEFDWVLNDTIPKIHEILSKWIYDDSFDVIKLIKLSKSLSEKQQYNVLYYLIESGIYLASFYSNELNLETNHIHINMFTQWLKNWWDDLIFSDNYMDFINLYNNPNELLEKIWIMWFLEQYDYFRYENQQLPQFSNDKANESFNNFKQRYIDSKLDERLNLMSIYDWELIIENVFEEYENIKWKFDNLFTLTNKEKEKFNKLKTKILNAQYEEDIIFLKNELNTRDFSLKNQLNCDWNNITNFEDNFKKELIDISILKNHWNKFSITFLDICWKKKSIDLTSNLSELNSLNNSYMDKNVFTKNAYILFNEYINNYKKNEFEFTILISKSNWEKDWTDNEWVNNINYTWKVLKIA